MSKVITSMVLLAVIFMACKNNPQKEFRTKTGKTILLNETHPMGVSLSQVEIVPSGLKDKKPIEVGETDPIQKAELADLDQDGFDELYLFTLSPGSGSYGKILAYSSDKDEKLVKITIHEIGEKDLARGGIFEGYRGHDKFQINKNRISRSFPVYLKNDPNSNPSGGEKTVYYSLKDNVLKIEK